MLSIADLRVTYDHPVLHGIDLAVEAGEMVCILGPSGGGKSTLLRAVAGLVDYTGTVVIGGAPVDGVPAHRRGVGLMFQDDLLFTHLDVAGNVGFATGGRRVAEMLDLVGLPGFEHRTVETLSGGQAQRVALARALAPAPRVLLLDEPFGALDPLLRVTLTSEVQRVLRAAGVTVLAVTHDRQEAFTLADRVAVLREGRLLRVGTPDQLWRDPGDAYTARLLGLSVLQGVAYPAEALQPDPQGPWDVTVTGRTFSEGTYLVSGTVQGDTVTYRSAGPVEVGRTVRLGFTPQGRDAGIAIAERPASPAS